MFKSLKKIIIAGFWKQDKKKRQPKLRKKKVITIQLLTCILREEFQQEQPMLSITPMLASLKIFFKK